MCFVMLSFHLFTFEDEAIFEIAVHEILWQLNTKSHDVKNKINYKTLP